MLFHIAELARSEPFTKRLGMIPHMPGTHQKLRKVRASRRIAAVAPLLLYLARTLKRTRHALGSQALSNQFGALPTASMQLGDSVFQRTRLRVKGIAEHMNGRPIPLAGQLNAADQADTQRFGGGAGSTKSFEGVVIGQRKQFDPTRMRPFDQYLRGQDTIGRGAVAMQIDNHSGAHSPKT